MHPTFVWFLSAEYILFIFHQQTFIRKPLAVTHIILTYTYTINQTIMIIDEILKYNEQFVASKGYEQYLTSKYPDKRLAILSCMDTRLTELLPAALGIKNGDAKLIKNAGGLVISPFDSAMRSILVAIYELHVEEIMVIAHSNCGACHMNGKAMKQAMIERGIQQDVIDTVAKCGIDLDHWLEGFHDTEDSVRNTVNTIRNHPLVPKDVNLHGYIIDSHTGKLTEVK